ncbi:MAG: hypothetical protein ABII12_05075 [Planctomycetota bacterium]
MNEHAKRNALYTLVAGLVLLAYAKFSGFEGVSEDRFFNFTVDFFNWMLWIGGAGFILAAGICWAGKTVGLLLDAGLSGLCGLILLLCGGYWLVDAWKAQGFVFQYALFALFGLLFCKAGCTSYGLFKQSRAGQFAAAPAVGAPAEPTEPEPPHPASVHPESLPRNGQPPPEDGYLAALSKEKDEPPTDPPQ